MKDETMPAKLHYSRHRREATSEHKSVKEAARFSVEQQNRGEIFALKIEDESGAVVWERGELYSPHDDERLEQRGIGMRWLMKWKGWDSND